ncbi:MAG TPA: ribulose-phosphate 3-epimerase [Chryseolinea sp.]|nr:ribulose-phosphate 3-epimerase [Chryseolinea sp.]
MKVPLIAPSVLAADFANLERDVKMINESEADWIHVDIMDGVFVPNFSMGIPVVEAIKRHSKKPLDVHLMIVSPEHHVEKFRAAGADNISIHLEVCKNMHRNIQQIKAMGCQAGIAINPHTPVAALQEVINDIDLVCVMSVNPGFGGQTFISHTFTKVEQLRDLIRKSGSQAKIEIDGGVNMVNAKELLDSGADVLVAGNFIFSAKNPATVIRELKAIQ